MPSASPHILVVDDEPDIRELVREILADEGYEVSMADCGEAARSARQHHKPDLVLLDIWMPDIDGITLLKEWMEEDSAPSPVIMMSGHGTVETAVEATRFGAYDFLEKPLSLAKLLLTVRHALEKEQLQRENIGLKERIAPVDEPIGKSLVMEDLRQQLERVAQHDTPVLITGESGSGKHVCARYLHEHGSRARGPFIEVGVAAIASGNSEVELFGSEAGGKVHFGRLEQSNGGTLFLHDIADMDLATQSRLASALTARSFKRIGGTDPVEVDVRLIASSRADLETRVKDGRFREDLYYQLNVVPVMVPPLRQHSEDIPELLGFYVDYFATHDNLAYRSFSVAAQNRLRNHSWPGNIRELKNLVQRLLIVGSGEQIDLGEVETVLGEMAMDHEIEMPVSIFDQPLREARDKFEKAYLEHHLKLNDGNVSQVAKISGMERTHLYRKMRGLDIDPKKLVD